MKNSVKTKKPATLKPKDIGAELSEYLKNNLTTEVVSNKNFIPIQKGIMKIVRRHYPTKTHQTFAEVYAVGNSFYALIGNRAFSDEKFGFINCKVGF